MGMATCRTTYDAKNTQGDLIMKRVEQLKDFARTMHDTGRSDRDVVAAFGGMTGEGKSVAMIQMIKEYCKSAGIKFTFDCMTWSREELLKWIDGDKDGKGQLPEYSPVIADELISMFYRRNWYEDDQKAAVELFNKCRDRHLFITGAIPNFWDLDGGMLSRIRFYIYIPRRGVMWVFEQENNPFAGDKWNVSENKKVFRKHKNPYRCPNFLCEITYDDLEANEKKRYYEIRNTKRRNTELQNKKTTQVEKYKHIKKQRDEAIRMIYETGDFTHLQISERTKIGRTLITRICNGTG